MTFNLMSGFNFVVWLFRYDVMVYLMYVTENQDDLPCQLSLLKCFKRLAKGKTSEWKIKIIIVCFLMFPGVFRYIAVQLWIWKLPLILVVDLRDLAWVYCALWENNVHTVILRGQCSSIFLLSTGRWHRMSSLYH